MKAGPHIAWRPSAELLKSTNITALLKEKKLSDVTALYDYSICQGQDFWGTICKRLGIKFSKPYTQLVDIKNIEAPKWLIGAELNIVESCFQADSKATAILYQKEGSGELQAITYQALQNKVACIANALQANGFKPGDKIAIDMPMNVEAVAIFLSIMAMGGTVVALADSFKAPDIEARLDAAAPVKAIFTQDVTGGARAFPLYDSVLAVKNLPPAIVVGKADLKRSQDRHFDDFIKAASKDFKPVALGPEAHLIIIFSSSTSSPKEKEGDKPKPPKAIPWKANTAIKSAVDGHLHHDMHAGDVLCWPTNLGWMMGAFAVFATFINQGVLALFDGNCVTPQFCRFVEKAKVNVLGVVPSIVEGWERRDMTKNCDWSAIKLFSSTGSPSNPKNYLYLMNRAEGNRPVIEYMGGTEIGGGYLTGTLHHPASPSCFTTPAFGIEIYTPEKDSADARKGEVFIVMRNGKGECPSMGLSTELLNYNHHDKYFERGLKHDGYVLREHGDLIEYHENGFITSNGRADDGININGIKTSSLDIENYIKDARIPGLKEVAAIGVRPPQGGEDWLVIYTVGEAKAESLRGPIRDAIKQRNPQLARVQDVVVIDSLPLTASGKLRRRYLQDLYLEQKS